MVDFGSIILSLIAILGVAANWLFSWLKPKKQSKKSDFQFMAESTKELVNSISALTSQNQELVGKLVKEQHEKLQLIGEKHELVNKINDLENMILQLKEQINKLLKNKK